MCFTPGNPLKTALNPVAVIKNPGKALSPKRLGRFTSPGKTVSNALGKTKSAVNSGKTILGG